MPYPLRPADPAAVKAKKALFMGVLLGAEIATRRTTTTRLAAPCQPVGLPDVAGPTLRFKRPQPPLVPLFVSAPGNASQRSARPRLPFPKTPAPPSRAALRTTLTIRLQAAERGQPAVKVLADSTRASAGRAVHNCEGRGGERSGKHSQRSTRSRGVAVCVGSLFACVRGGSMKIPRIAGHLRECRRGKQSRRGASQ